MLLCKQHVIDSLSSSYASSNSKPGWFNQVLFMILPPHYGATVMWNVWCFPLKLLYRLYGFLLTMKFVLNWKQWYVSMYNTLSLVQYWWRLLLHLIIWFKYRFLIITIVYSGSSVHCRYRICCVFSVSRYTNVNFRYIQFNIICWIWWCLSLR